MKYLIKRSIVILEVLVLGCCPLKEKSNKIKIMMIYIIL